MDLSLYANPEALKNKTGHLAITPLRSWPLSRRSGRFPALPCPPLRSIRILTHETETFVALVITVGVENVVPNICPVAGFEVITIGRFCGDNRGFRFVLCPSPEPESNWLRAILLNRTVRGNGFVSSAASSISSWQPALASNLQARTGRASISVWCRLRFCHRQPEIKSGIETDSSLLLVS